MQTVGLAAHELNGSLQKWEFARREVGEDDVLIDILFCGICHSDIHQVHGDWGNSVFPMVPGHEIVGRVSKIGSKVTNIKVGDLAGVGCMVDSCRQCTYCKDGEEQMCEHGSSMTYNGTEQDKKTPTYGGYSQHIVVKSHFAVHVSDKFTNLAAVAPLLCAGITTYSPLAHWKAHVGPGKKVGINGLGGLGHMGVKFAVAFGAEVTVFSTSPSKEGDAKRLGAHHFVISKDNEAMEKLKNSYDLILDTVSAEHPIAPLVNALKPRAVLALVGAPPAPHQVPAMGLIFGNKIIAGSLIGGIKETQEMLDFCAQKGIVSDIELISADRLGEAYERTMKSDVKYRFVIDISTIKK